MPVKLEIIRPDKLEVDEYREFKLRILKRDFKIKLSASELRHFELLSTIGEIDSYFVTILNQRWF